MNETASEKWKEFFMSLQEGIENLECSASWNDKVLTRPNQSRSETEIWKSRCLQQYRLAATLRGTIQGLDGELVQVFEYRGVKTERLKATWRGVQYYYTRHEVTLKITDDCKKILKALAVPKNFSCENPAMKHFDLSHAEIRSVVRAAGKPLFEGMYEPRDDEGVLDQVPEAHLDVIYEELFELSPPQLWSLTLTKRMGKINDVPNSGTEFIRVPCMKHTVFHQISSFQPKIRFCFRAHGETRSCPADADTFIGTVLYILTSIYCDRDKVNWECTQPGFLHTAASAHFHRSPRLKQGQRPRFWRTHYLLDNIILSAAEEPDVKHVLTDF